MPPATCHSHSPINHPLCTTQRSTAHRPTPPHRPTAPRLQIEDIAEAVQTMSSPTACAVEREEMKELEEEREAHREVIDEARPAPNSK